jgi:hypothetical protein
MQLAANEHKLYLPKSRRFSGGTANFTVELWRVQTCPWRDQRRSSLLPTGKSEGISKRAGGDPTPTFI